MEGVACPVGVRRVQAFGRRDGRLEARCLLGGVVVVLPLELAADRD